MLKHNLRVGDDAALTPALSRRERENGDSAAPAAEAALADVAERMADELREKGEVDVRAWQEKYPQFASEIGRIVPTLGLLVDLSSPSREEPLSEIEDAIPNKTLGDFRIVRELGRGGMGIVYEAEQLSLNRRVALKILPTAAVLDPRTLQRFKNEAQAAAALDHPHIVDVYGVGCERCVHYYAMRLIEGCTLGDVVAELRSQESGVRSRRSGIGSQEPVARDQWPGNPKSKIGNLKSASTVPVAFLSTARTGNKGAFFQKVAELGIHVAEGLAAAHEQGIVHRDIKPSNLMLDAQGKVWITDFGLAQIETSQTLTIPGDLLGTLRYMSPEQTLANRAVVDHRADIYSLGATLYELLTLRPVFDGDDRADVIRQIALVEPMPPRRLNPHIPADLETIVLKMLEKDAASRYASAGDLAAELRRFVENKPITARRPSAWRRVSKWSGRNRGLVGGLAAGVLAMAMAVGGVLGWQSRDNAAQRQIVERIAGEAIAAADGFRQQRKWQEAGAELERAKAAVATRPADAALVRRIDERMKEARFVQRLEEIRLLAATLAGGDFDFRAADAAYRGAFSEQGYSVAELRQGDAPVSSGDTVFDEAIADALTNWAIVATRRGDPSGGNLLAAAAKLDPDPWRNRLRQVYGTRQLPPAKLRELVLSAPVENLPAATLFLLVQASASSGINDGDVISRLQLVQRLHAEDFWINFALARFFESVEPPQYDAAVRYYSVAVAIRPSAAAAHSNLGTALHRQGKRDEALAEFRLAIEAEPGFWAPYSNLGMALFQEKQYGEALAALRKAKELREERANSRFDLAAAEEPAESVKQTIAECLRMIEASPGGPDVNQGSR